MRGVLQLVREKSGWGTRTLPKGTGMGVAFQFSTAATSRDVAEVRVGANNTVKVNKVWVVGDVGSQIINPSSADQPGAGRRHRRPEPVDGATRSRSTPAGPCRATSTTIPPVRLHAGAAGDRGALPHPNNPPTGLGEPALPPIVPAVCNAIFAATGTRIRSLPLSKSGYRWA